jgi:hypothetical protein
LGHKVVAIVGRGKKEKSNTQNLGVCGFCNHLRFPTSHVSRLTIYRPRHVALIENPFGLVIRPNIPGLEAHANP